VGRTTQQTSTDAHESGAAHSWTANAPLPLIHLRCNPAAKAGEAEGVRAAGGTRLVVVFAAAASGDGGDKFRGL